MATKSQTWSMFTVILALAVQLCIGVKPCVIWSSAGPVVQRGSTFKVYCTFNCKCKYSMFNDQLMEPQSHQKFNYTTTYLNVVNITTDSTYSCVCACDPEPQPDPCGIDISVGYPPDRPTNISCLNNVLNNGSGLVNCTWNSGRHTYIKTTAKLEVITVSESHTGEPLSVTASSKGTDFPSASFIVDSSVQFISVWIKAQNVLNTTESAPINYSLSDIAIPSTPVLGQPNCSSRQCIIKVEQKTPHLEIQYRTEQHPWTTNPDSEMQSQSISSLEPYRLYHFRARSRFSSGLWSQWSEHVSSWTQEEAPAKELDVWYSESASDSNSLTVYWKDTDISIARGKILEYIVNVNNSDSKLIFITNLSAQNRNCLVQSCPNCEVTVCARNSKGLSPPARITTYRMTAEPPPDVHFTPSNHSVTISWSKPETALLPAGYVVEWYPEGYKQEELRWNRLSRNDNHAVITGVNPFECYEAAVYVLYNDRSMTRSRSTRFYTMESAPVSGPSVKETVKGDTVIVTWTELPRGQRGGCITQYTIYLENSSGKQETYNIKTENKREHIIKSLPPSGYSLWMTAWTAKGEGPAGQKVKIFIQQDNQLHLILVCAVVFIAMVFLLCLCQSSAVKQRLWVYFQCFMLDVVPDPANSKWAKECTQEKGKMNLPLQLSNSSTTEEDEPILVDVEELPRQICDISVPSNVSSQPTETQPATLLYPLTTYIKSFSHDSDSSDHTHTSLETNTTIDYISSHGLGNMDEEDQEEEERMEEEEEFAEVLGFFPSHNAFMEPLMFGGKLTLDAVKIDCSNFENS